MIVLPQPKKKTVAGLDLPARIIYISAAVLGPRRFAPEIIL